MIKLFETVITLSLLGFIISSVLLCIKPFTAKKLPAKWQYYVWIAVLISMIIPTYKLIPANQVQKIEQLKIIEVPNIKSENVSDVYFTSDASQTTTVMNKKINITRGVKISIFELVSIIWIIGVFVFLLTVTVSYAIYILKLRKNSMLVEHNAVFNQTKKELKIRRNIRLRISPRICSPMLVGVFFPVVYMPCKEIPHDMMNLVFLHELTHYKRKDLIIKWFALFVNTVHWFNPISYLISANLSEACEISCDMEVTQNMSDEEQKLYMKTILELVE